MAVRLFERKYRNPTVINKIYFCSQAVRVGDTIYLSGSLGLLPETGNLTEVRYPRGVRYQGVRYREVRYR